MFKLHDFIMKTLNGMVGNYPDFQVREYALNWYAKGVLTEDDLATVEEWLEPVLPEEVTDEVQEELPQVEVQLEEVQLEEVA